MGPSRVWMDMTIEEVQININILKLLFSISPLFFLPFRAMSHSGYSDDTI